MPSAREFVMPAGSASLVPAQQSQRSGGWENWWNGGDSAAEPENQGYSSSSAARSTPKKDSYKKASTFKPRSEVLRRAPAPAPEYNPLTDCLAREASDLLVSDCGPPFDVLVDRTDGRSLGIEVEHYSERVLTVMTINEGIVQDWNDANPGLRLEPHDVIVAVNDVTGDVELILDECRKPAPLRLTARRPASKAKKVTAVDVEYKITLDKRDGDKLGIDVNHEDGSELFIESIDPGLVETWNIQNPDREVAVEDRIIEVNGVRGDVTQLLAECTQNTTLEITLLRCELREH